MKSSECFSLTPDCIRVPEVITQHSILAQTSIDITGVEVIHVPPPMTSFITLIISSCKYYCFLVISLTQCNSGPVVLEVLDKSAVP